MIKNAVPFAKFLLKKGADTVPNSFDGNMKLQKLLTFSDVICLSEYNRRLFSDPVLAFQNGCVVESIRIRYNKDYNEFKKDSDLFDPDFTEEEYNVLKLTLGIFGEASARELSKLNHTFAFWADSYRRGTQSNGFHDKEKSIVRFEDYPEEIKRVGGIVKAYKESENDIMACEIVNGVKFYYDGFSLTEDILNELDRFSLAAEDEAYSMYFDDGRLVIY